MSIFDTGKPTLEDVLSHYGVKGMKWGVRKKKATDTAKRAASATGRGLKKVGKAFEDYEMERNRLKGEAFITDLFGLNSPARQQLNTYDAIEASVANAGARAVKKLLKADD